MASETFSDLLRSRPGGTGAFGPLTPPRILPSDDPKNLAAENLVAKATSRLHDGDESRARQAVARVAGLGWFALEEVPYAVFAAQGVLFDEIVDSLESEEPSEWAWRDACLALLEDASELEAQVLRDPLAAILNDYDLPKQQMREVRRAVAHARADASFGLDEQSSVEQVGAVVWAMVSLTSRLHALLHH